MTRRVNLSKIVSEIVSMITERPSRVQENMLR